MTKRDTDRSPGVQKHIKSATGEDCSTACRPRQTGPDQFADKDGCRSMAGLRRCSILHTASSLLAVVLPIAAILDCPLFRRADDQLPGQFALHVCDNRRPENSICHFRACCDLGSATTNGQDRTSADRYMVSELAANLRLHCCGISVVRHGDAVLVMRLPCNGDRKPHRTMGLRFERSAAHSRCTFAPDVKWLRMLTRTGCRARRSWPILSHRSIMAKLLRATIIRFYNRLCTTRTIQIPCYHQCLCNSNRRLFICSACQTQARSSRARLEVHVSKVEATTFTPI